MILIGIALLVMSLIFLIWNLRIEHILKEEGYHPTAKVWLTESGNAASDLKEANS